MPDPLTFASTTARHSLPNLFPGQAQKEFYVNEAHAILDTLIHPAIEEELAAPPSSPVEGGCWLVASGGTGEWAGHVGDIASWQSGHWLFASPSPGMRIHDVSSGGSLAFTGIWQRLVAPASPSGGTTVDSEARAAIDNLIATLRSAGVFPAT